MGARLILALMRLLARLPFGTLVRAGELLGIAAYWVVVPRRRVCLINLEKCFPEQTPSERRALAKAHFRLLGRFVLEHGVMWWGARARFAELVQYENKALLDACLGEPLIILAPHFLGLDMGGVRLTLDTSLASMYQKQKNAVFDEQIRAGRLRFTDARSRLFSRQDGVMAIARAIRSGIPLYYLPDLDFGPRDTIFVPFFGIPTATITGVARLAKVARARVLPCVTEMLPGDRGYRIRFYPPWTDFPTDDVAADTRRVNAFIEERVREMPAQYYWVHKRFKTRPPGAPSFYRR